MKFYSKSSLCMDSGYANLFDGFCLDSACLMFLNEKNVATPIVPACFFVGGEQFDVDFFLGRSNDPSEDLMKVFRAYVNRIPSGYIPVCHVNDGDYACLGKDGGVYVWRRDFNDLYFDPGCPNSYKPQNTELLKVSNNFSEFIEAISEINDSDDFCALDDYENPSLPFDDEDIEDDFNRPDLFFKQSPDAISIQLRKLELSEKGRELLKLFECKGLI